MDRSDKPAESDAADQMGGVKPPPPKPPRKRYPLGLPSGSVRALLTLMVVAVVVVTTLRGEKLELLWAETLMIALAHYFTSRRMIDLSPEALQWLADHDQIQDEAHPLFLPRHSIRALIIASFIGLAVYLYQQDRLWDPQSLAVLGIVASYFLGMLTRGVARLVLGERSGGMAWWGDAKAFFVLAVVCVTAVCHLMGFANTLPQGYENFTLALVLFYFGSR